MVLTYTHQPHCGTLTTYTTTNSRRTAHTRPRLPDCLPPRIAGGSQSWALQWLEVLLQPLSFELYHFNPAPINNTPSLRHRRASPSNSIEPRHWRWFGLSRHGGFLQYGMLGRSLFWNILHPRVKYSRIYCTRGLNFPEYFAPGGKIFRNILHPEVKYSGIFRTRR